MNLRQPDAILQGHTHKLNSGKDKETGTVIVNPGNLGRYENTPGGNIVEIDYNQETGMVIPTRLWKILGNHDVRHYSIGNKSA